MEAGHWFNKAPREFYHERQYCLFLVVRQAYYKHIDLQITGRTVMGMVDSRNISAMFKFVD